MKAKDLSERQKCIVEYQVVSGNGQSLLQDEVNRMISWGWRLQGGVSTTPDSIYLQAMTHEIPFRDRVFDPFPGSRVVDG